MASIDDLPEELLDHIFTMISPYKDLHSCSCVSKKWKLATKRVVKRRIQDFNRALKCNKLRWESKQNPKITLRHSHASCFADGVIYVFGGCSSTDTSFNDLLALDLTTREFNRLFVQGSIPSPKANATLSRHKQKLILLGGWAHPSRLVHHVPLILFNELHIFDISTATWSTPDTKAPAQAFASHSATVHGDTMVVFGGVKGGTQITWSSAISCLDLNNYTWSFPQCSEIKPSPRFGQSQIYLDEKHLLIIGGTNCIKLPRSTCDDVWMLDMSQQPWQWIPITLKNQQWAAPHLWCHPVVRYGNSIAAFSRSSTDDSTRYDMSPEEEKPLNAIIFEENVNGKHGSFNNNHDRIHDAASNQEERPGPANAARCDRSTRRQRQLEAIAKFEKKLGHVEKKKESSVNCSPKMNLYLADISEVVEKRVITWLQPRYKRTNPADRILYSLVAGHAELVMFGGLAMDGEATGTESARVVYHSPLRFAMPPTTLL